MKDILKLALAVVIDCACICDLKAMEQHQMTTKQVNQWKGQITGVLNSQTSTVKTQISELKKGSSAQYVGLKISLLEWKIQLLWQEKQLIDGYNVNNSKRTVFSLVELIYQMTQANEALHKLLTNQVDAGNLSLAKQAVQAKQNLQREIPANHPIHQNFARFSELAVLYNQSNNEKEKAEILKEIQALKDQVDQM